MSETFHNPFSSRLKSLDVLVHVFYNTIRAQETTPDPTSVPLDTITLAVTASTAASPLSDSNGTAAVWKLSGCAITAQNEMIRTDHTFDMKLKDGVVTFEQHPPHALGQASDQAFSQAISKVISEVAGQVPRGIEPTQDSADYREKLEQAVLTSIGNSLSSLGAHLKVKKVNCEGCKLHVV